MHENESNRIIFEVLEIECIQLQQIEAMNKCEIFIYYNLEILEIQEEKL